MLSYSFEYDAKLSIMTIQDKHFEQKDSIIYFGI